MADTVTLYRPVGPEELELIRQSGFAAFPPRLPDQPIFYPVLTEAYAVKIARDWNVPASGAGYVTRFDVLSSFLSAFDVQNAGGVAHQEYWIPAESLPAFNAAIVGKIDVVAEFHRRGAARRNLTLVLTASLVIRVKAKEDVMKQLRINDPTQLDTETIEHHHAEGHDIIVQFSKRGYSESILRILNKLCERFLSRFQVRFYGHYGTSFDCLTTRLLPSVRSLAVDCLINAENINALRELENLDELRLGVFELDQKDILNSSNFMRLKSLSLSETRNKGIDLSPIAGFEFLSSLLISGHTKGIEAISHLTKLSSLRLRQIGKRKSLEFVNAIENLTELEIVLGGRTNIHEITHPRIRTLRIIRVRGFETFQPTAFYSLEELQIEDQIRINEISFSHVNKSLSRILLINCKNLSSLRGLGLLPKLHEIRIAMTSLDINDMLDAALPPTLKTFAFYSGKAGENLAIRGRLDQLGYGEMTITA